MVSFIEGRDVSMLHIEKHKRSRNSRIIWSWRIGTTKSKKISIKVSDTACLTYQSLHSVTYTAQNKWSDPLLIYLHWLLVIGFVDGCYGNVSGCLRSHKSRWSRAFCDNLTNIFVESNEWDVASTMLLSSHSPFIQYILYTVESLFWSSLIFVVIVSSPLQQINILSQKKIRNS